MEFQDLEETISKSEVNILLTRAGKTILEPSTANKIILTYNTLVRLVTDKYQNKWEELPVDEIMPLNIQLAYIALERCLKEPPKLSRGSVNVYTNQEHQE